MRAAAITAAILLPPAALRAQNAPTPARADTPTTAPASDLDRTVATLTNPNVSAQQRDEAAVRLVSRRTPDARQLVRQLLADARYPAAQAAVARALAADVGIDPDPNLIDPLFVLLNGGVRPAGAALGNYHGRADVLDRLINAARQRQNEPARLTAIEALGRVTERAAVETLIAIVTREDEPERVRNVASDSLMSLTGLVDNDRDPQRWSQWWSANANRNDVDFRNDLITNRARRYDVLADRHADLADAVERELTDQYRAALPTARPAMLMRMLTSDAPELRALGAALVLEDRLQGRPVQEAAIARLREMIGDSDPQVRLAAVKGLAGDKLALDALLAQLPVEQNPDVRAALARALGPIGDVRAAGPLVDLLSDPSVVVAKAACDALRALGPSVRASDPALPARAKPALENLLRRSDRPGMEDLRESVAGAMASLADPALSDPLQRLANRSEPFRVRREAVRGLGNIGDPRAGDYILDTFLGNTPDPEPSVQVEALNALVKLGRVEFYASIAALTASPDDSVRRAAWTALVGLMPRMPSGSLIELTRIFANDPAKLVEVLRVLADEQQKAGQLNDWADTRQTMGQALMKLNRPAEADECFTSALEQRNKQPGTLPIILQRLIIQVLQARLDARQFDRAAAFASDVLSRDPSQQETVGPLICQTAERLSTDKSPQSQDDVLRLIAEARGMNQPLAPRYLDILTGIENQVKQQRPATSAPQGQLPPPGP
jgi:HEAT repeat protein